MTNLAVAIRLTADGSAFVGEIKLSRDALTGLTDAANDAGQALDRAGGSGNVADLDAWRRSMQATAEDLSRTSRGLREFQQALEATAAGVRASRTETEATGRGTVTALEQVRRAYDPVYAAAARYRDELRAVLKALNDNNVQGGERIRILRAVAEAHNPVIQANRQEAASLQLLTDRLEPAAAATRRLAEDQALLDRALAGGRIDAESHGRLTTALKEQSLAARDTAGSTRLAAHEMTNLSFQVQDVVAQLGSGTNPFVILAQQGPQAVGAVGGVGRALSLLRTPMTGVVAGATALAGAFALVVSRAVSIQAELRGWDVALQATGQQAGVTAAEIRGITEEMVRLGASRDDAVAALSAALDTRKLGSADQLREIGRLAVDLGVRLGGTAEAGQKLSEWLTTGTAGLRALSQATGALTVEQYEAARAALEQGDRLKANAIVIDALKQRFQGLRQESLGPVQQAMERLNREFNAFVDVAAKASAPLVISVSVTGAEWLKGLVEFLSNPTPQAFARWQMMGNPLWGMNGTSLPPTEPAPPAPSVGSPFTGRPTAAGTSAGRYGTRLNGLTNDEEIAIDELKKANDRLAAAYQKTGAAREIAIAKEQAYIAAINAGKSVGLAKAEADEAARMASVQAAAAIADQTAEVTIQTRATRDAAAAVLAGTVSAAAGWEALGRAQAEALATGVDPLTRQRQILEEQAAATALAGAKQVDQMEREVIARRKVAEAAGASVAAQKEEELQAKIQAATLEETIALQHADAETKEILLEVIRRKTAAVRGEAVAERELALATMEQQEGQRGRRAAFEAAMAGAPEAVRALATAEFEVLEALRAQGIEYDALDTKGRKRVDDQVAAARARATLELDTQRTTAAYKELEQFGERAMDALLEKIVEAGDGTLEWRDAVKALWGEFQTLALRMAVINPIKNWALGSNLPTLWDLAGAITPAASGGGVRPVTAGTPAAANQNAQSGGGTGGLSIGSLSRLTDPSALPGWWHSPVFGSSGSTANSVGVINDGTAGFDTTGAFDAAGNPLGGATGATWGQVATAAGAALSAFNAFRAFSQGQIGSGIGNTISAGLGIAQLAGVALGPLGPIAMVAAPIIGGLLDGLFAKKPSAKEGGSTINLTTGAETIGGQTGKKFSQENRDAASDISQAVYEMYKGLSDLAGGKTLPFDMFVGVTQTGIRAQYNGPNTERTFGKDDAGIKELTAWFAGIFTRELKDGFEPAVQRAIDNIDWSDLETGMKQLQFAIDFPLRTKDLAGNLSLEDATRRQAKEGVKSTTTALKEFLETTEKLWPAVQQGGRTVTTTTRELTEMSAAEAIGKGLLTREQQYMGDATWETVWKDVEGRVVQVGDDLSQTVAIWRDVTKTVTEGGQAV
ncbi:hypothetical protein HL658_31390, partial [Azospirillum sp. RWY-5-1]